MSPIVVVTVQHGIVDQLHLFLLILLQWLLLGNLSITNWRRVGSLDLMHEVSHQILSETIKRTVSELLHFVSLWLLDEIQRISHWLFKKFNHLVRLVFFFLLYLFDRAWLQWVSFNLDVLLYFVLELTHFFFLQVRALLLLEKSFLCKSWELMAQLHIIWVAEPTFQPVLRTLAQFALHFQLGLFESKFLVFSGFPLMSKPCFMLTHSKLRMIGNLHFFFGSAPRVAGVFAVLFRQVNFLTGGILIECKFILLGQNIAISIGEEILSLLGR